MNSTDITKYLLNDMPIGLFIAMMLIAFMGVLVFFLIDVAYAVKNDKTSPVKFDFWYMLKTGSARIVISLIFLFICIAYFGEISQIVFQVEQPVEINGAIAFLIGIQIDAIVKKGVGFGRDSGKVIKKIF